MKKGFVLAGANLSGALLSLGRNIIIARLLAPDEFGIASTLALTLALLEMLSNIGVNSLVVQAKDGNRPRLQADLHGIQLVRAALAGGLLLALAGPYAWLMGAEQAVWAYQVMAVVPILRGLRHLDVFRSQRKRDYRPFAVATVISQVLAVAAVWPLSAMGLNYEIMLWTIVLQQVSFTALTHVMAERRFRIRWSNTMFRRVMVFGLPLLGNGILLFAIFHGDRVIIANQAGMAVLGWFAVAATLTLTPSTVLATTLQSWFLPRLSRLQDDAVGFARASASTIEACCAMGVLMTLGFALVGTPLLIGLFGEKYADALQVLIWLAIVQGIRLGKAGPTIVAIAKAETTNPLIANIVRCVALPLAFLALVNGAPVVTVVWAAIVGEVLSMAVAMFLLHKRLDVSLGRYGVPLAATAAILLAMGVAAELAPAPPTIWPVFHWSQPALIAAFCVYILMLPTLRVRLFARLGR